MLSEKPWRAEAVTQFIAGLFICLCFGMLVALVLHQANVGGFRELDDFGMIVVGTLSKQGATWALIGIFLWQHGMNWRDPFGFRGPQLKRALLAGVALAFLILPVVWLLQVLSADLLTRVGWVPEPQTAVTLFKETKNWLELAYLALFAIVIAPVAEEFLFRGILYPFVKQLGSPRYALFGINAIFALIHFDLGTLLPLFALALALTWLYEKTDNLLAPITAHAMFNAINLVVLYFGEQINQLIQHGFQLLYHFLHPA
ncbi:MAG TPA: CPBP family intramembrane glutamic endopeptidase [Verrucomicrobiae bacterium]